MITLKTNIPDVVQQIQEFMRSLQTMGEEALFNAATEVQAKMQIEGDSVPIYPPAWLSPVGGSPSWDSERQKRAFFATGGFGKGIPYQRTGAYEQGWIVNRVDGGAELSNPSPAGAIGGTPSLEGWQSNIHVGRWNNIYDVLDTLDITRLFADEWNK